MAPADNDLVRGAKSIQLPPEVRQALGGGNVLTSWWLVVAALALLVLMVTATVKARRRRAVRWGTSGGIVVAVVVAAALTANCISGYVPDADALRMQLASWGVVSAPSLHHSKATASAGGRGQGAVQAFSVPTPADLKMAHNPVWVYTPPGYVDSPQARYPVVYLIHGSPGRSGDWFAAGKAAQTMDVLIAHKLIRPMVIVAPDVNGLGPGGRDTECLNSTTGGAQVDTYLTTVLVPWVDATFRTEANRAHRVIGGFSSGGFCALDLGLHHKDLYGQILSIGTYPDSGSGGRRMLATRAEWLAHAPGAYLRQPQPQPPPTFLATGTRTGRSAQRNAHRMAQLLTDHGGDVVLKVVQGEAHTWHLARDVLPYALLFASERMPPQ